MEGITRRGVYLDMTLSPYKYPLPRYHIELVFSSKLYLDKYASTISQFVEGFNPVGKKITLPVLDWGVIPYIEYYWKVERRGFLIYRDGIPTTHKDIGYVMKLKG